MNKAPHVWHWVCLNSEEELPGTSTNAPPLLFTSYEFATVPVIMCLVAQSCPTLFDPMDCSPPGSSVGFSRQEYWSGLPFPSPGDLPNPGIKPRPPALQADTLLTEPPGKPTCNNKTS